MADERELKVGVGRRVDKTEAMALARLEDDLGVRPGTSDGVLGSTVDKDVIGGRRAGNAGILNNPVRGPIIIVANGEDTEVYFIRKRGRTMNQDSTDHPVSVLCREVRVVFAR